jgi:hypothetical protein
MGNKLKHSDPKVLCYTDGKRKSNIRWHYDLWRKEQNPPIPERCDNENCQFYSGPLVWEGKPLKLILDHINGVNSDNRPKNIRLLCPNCDSQNKTRGGANKGKTKKYPGGFTTIDEKGGHHYVLPAETGRYTLGGSAVNMKVEDKDWNEKMGIR